MEKIYEKIVFHLPTGGLHVPTGGYSTLALPWKIPTTDVNATIREVATVIVGCSTL